MRTVLVKDVFVAALLVRLAHAQSLPAPVTSGYTQTDLDRCKFFSVHQTYDVFLLLEYSMAIR